MSISSDVEEDRRSAPVAIGHHRPSGGPSARPRTQRERVLAALRRAGERGLTQVDWLLHDVIDGGPPIVRLPARVDELRQAGHHIEHAGRRNRCVIYRLADLPAPVVSPQLPDDDPTALFGPMAPRRQRSRIM